MAILDYVDENVKPQRGFTLIHLGIVLGILVALGGLITWANYNIATTAGVKKGEASKQAEWSAANAKAEAEATRLRLEREAEARKTVAALHNAETEARNATERWKAARIALGRTPLAVCPTPQPAAPDAATGTVASPDRPDAGIRLTFAYVLLHDRAWTGPDGQPVFGGAGEPAAPSPASGAASPYGLDQLLENHAENASRCSENSRQLSALIALIRRLRGG